MLRGILKRTPSDCGEPRQQFREGERLDQVVVGTGIESRHAFIHGAECRQNQDASGGIAKNSTSPWDIRAVGLAYPRKRWRYADITPRGTIQRTGHSMVRRNLPGNKPNFDGIWAGHRIGSITDVVHGEI
jgi:hypothetical protein